MEQDLYYRLLNEETKQLEQIDKNRVDSCSILEYMHLSCEGIWTKALQRAINEHKVVIIPPSKQPYLIDDTIIIPSNRTIIANGATLKCIDNMDVIMFRNTNTVDETHYPYDGELIDNNIAILGGTFEESFDKRAGYGRSGKYDKNRTYYGVSSLFFFNNLNHIMISDVTFKHCGGFALQTGLISNGIFKNIIFDSCYADGLHFTGNIENILVKNVEGYVGDDIVAFNMYDWQNSSVNFGPGNNIWCENVQLSNESKYKAIRFESGIYRFDNGDEKDCSLNHMMIKNITGIKTFKMYLQTPVYEIGSRPEWGKCGSMLDICFEDIEIDLNEPIDKFSEYLEGDKIRGTFAAFETGANIDDLLIKNICLKLYKDTYPMSFLLCSGPKSIVRNGKEVFDPYISSKVKNVTFENVIINGEKMLDFHDYIKEISFNDVNKDGYSSGLGIIENIIIC